MKNNNIYGGYQQQGGYPPTINDPDKKEDDEISLFEILEMLLRNWIPIAVTAVVCAVAAFTFIKLTAVPNYASSSTLYINTEREKATDDVNSKALIETQSLMPTYAKILDNKTFLKSICALMNNKYEYKQMKDMVTISVEEDTNLLNIYVKSNDSRDSYMICRYIADNAPAEIMRVFEGGSVKVIEQPEESDDPIMPNAVKYALIGFLLGAAAAVFVIFIKEMMDTRIRSSEELTAKYGLPILGEAPDFDMAENSTEGYYAKKR